MEEIGKVLEVFIPNEYKDELPDAMEKTKIGFKIALDNEVITIVQEQNKKNASIFKNDLVLIKKEQEEIEICLYKENNE